MAKMCNVTDPSTIPANLTDSANLCLKNLSRYTEISTIARKCYAILQEAGKRGSTNQQPQHVKPSGPMILSRPAVPVNATQSPVRRPTECAQGMEIQPVNDIQPLASTTVQTLGSQFPRYEASQVDTSFRAQAPPEASFSEQDIQHSGVLGDDFTELNSFDPVSWPNFPNLAQLESGFLATLLDEPSRYFE